MAQYKQSAVYSRLFLMVQSTDHISGLTGATVTVTLSKAGTAFGAASGAVTEIANGWYKIALSTTDTNTVGDLAFHCTATSGDPTDFADQVIGFDLTASVLPANVTQWNSSAVATPATAGVPDVNASRINSVVTTSVTTINANVGTTQPTNFTSTGGTALVKTDIVDIAGSAVASNSAQLGVNVVNWLGTGVAASTAGTPDVNTTRVNNIAATSVTTVNANLGTVQPINHTGTDGTALVKSDMIDVAGAAVSTSTAQIGVNSVNIGGQVAALDANNLLKVDIEDVNGSPTVETGINIRQTLQYCAAALVGVLAGAAGTTITISALNNSGTTRITATVDANDNRTAIVLS